MTHQENRALAELLQFRCSWNWIGAGIGTGFTLSMLAVAARRWKFLRGPFLATVGSVGLAGAAYSTLIEPRRPVLEQVPIIIPSLPDRLDGLRIGQLSDLHLNFLHTTANTKWAVQQMHDEAPDVIVITGDFVSFSRAISRLPDLLRDLHAPLGIYAVPGNHDHWEGLDTIRAHLEPIGIRFLMNSNQRLEWNDTPFWLVGVDDAWYGQPDLDTALTDVPNDGLKILLSHSPDYADVSSHYGIALQISGHTHGGHLNLPFLGWFCVPYHGLRYISGLERVGPMLLYVTRGLGGLPMRMNCPPEATILTLRKS